MRLQTLVFLLFFYILINVTVSNAAVEDFFKDFINASSSSKEVESPRRKKKGGKYTVPLLFGALLIKSIIFPLAFKAMAVMTSISVLLSTMSLIISSIIGYIKIAAKSTNPVKVVHKPQHQHSWAKDDENSVKNFYTIDNNNESKMVYPQGQYSII